MPPTATAQCGNCDAPRDTVEQPHLSSDKANFVVGVGHGLLTYSFIYMWSLSFFNITNISLTQWVATVFLLSKLYIISSSTKSNSKLELLTPTNTAVILLDSSLAATSWPLVLESVTFILSIRMKI